MRAATGRYSPGSAPASDALDHRSAIQKTRALRRQVRGAGEPLGDSGFAEGLEQMAFLANLVGIQHIERFIPLAEPGESAADAPATPPAAREGLTGTMEMPKFPQAMLREPPEVATRNVARTGAQAAHRPQGRTKAAKADEAAQQVREQVMADAARLMQWGRNWHRTRRTDRAHGGPAAIDGSAADTAGKQSGHRRESRPPLTRLNPSNQITINLSKAPMITINHLSKRYGGKLAVDDSPFQSHPARCSASSVRTAPGSPPPCA